ncbi:hypothetical protein EJB05_45380, partial [Eragrostis curvula]
ATEGGSQEPHAESNAQTDQSSKPYLNRGGIFLPPSSRSDRTTQSLAGAAPLSPATAAMVYVDSWDEFVERSVQLFRADPIATRYVMKYRHCEGKLVLKVTDDKEVLCLSLFTQICDWLVLDPGLARDRLWICLKFKTDQAQDAKKMEKLNNIFFTLMTRGPDADISEVSGKEQAEQQQSKKGRGRRQ